MYRDVMSMVKISLSAWPEKLKSQKIFSACVLSLMYGATTGRNDRATWVVRFVNFRQEVNARSSRGVDDDRDRVNAEIVHFYANKIQKMHHRNFNASQDARH